VSRTFADPGRLVASAGELLPSEAWLAGAGPDLDRALEAFQRRSPEHGFCPTVTGHELVRHAERGRTLAEWVGAGAPRSRPPTPSRSRAHPASGASAHRRRSAARPPRRGRRAAAEGRRRRAVPRRGTGLGGRHRGTAVGSDRPGGPRPLGLGRDVGRGQVVYEGMAAPQRTVLPGMPERWTAQRAAPGVGELVGGGPQVYLPNVPQDWVVRTGPLVPGGP
jgi:hypothetical protein